MTGQTVGHYLAGSMGLMALGAIRDPAVDIMAERTGLLGMHALVIIQFLALLLVAGQAGGNKIIGKLQT